MNLVTVYRTFDPARAHLIRSRLETAGLDAEVADETASQVVAGSRVPAVEIRVRVPDAQAEDAQALIAELEGPA